MIDLRDGVYRGRTGSGTFFKCSWNEGWFLDIEENYRRQAKFEGIIRVNKYIEETTRFELPGEFLE